MDSVTLLGFSMFMMRSSAFLTMPLCLFVLFARLNMLLNFF